MLFAALSAATAFQVCPQNNNNIVVSRRVMEPLRSASELSPIDEMCIENVAEFCLHESCDVEEYEALINQLEEQKTHFIKHVANVESLLLRLKDLNHPEHDANEVKVLIENIKNTLSNPPSTTTNSEVKVQ
jgi:hypothetical protein